MNKIISWVKTHQLTTVLFIILVWFLFKELRGPVLFSSPAPGSRFSADENYSITTGESSLPASVGLRKVAPAPEASDRLVVKHSNLSLLVKDVSESVRAIQSQVESFGGYMVSTSVRDPSGSATGSITVRVPVSRLDEALKYFRGLAVKVVSENLTGEDVTDQYVDIQARLGTHYRTKAKFESLLEQAVDFDDLLRANREIINIQKQIDALLGQQRLLEKTAQNSKVTLYLSTDEVALPYAPDQPWRPKVVFKRAVRSLILTYRSLGTKIIWIGVYAAVWVPILGLFLLARWGWKRWKRD